MIALKDLKSHQITVYNSNGRVCLITKNSNLARRVLKENKIPIKELPQDSHK